MLRPLKLILVLCLLLGEGAELKAQSDTINQLDNRDRRHGYWIITNGMHDPKHPSERKDSVYMCGRYEHGRKEGVWTYYRPIDGKINYKATYVCDTLYGTYWRYDYDGVLIESYRMEGLKMCGEFYIYTHDSLGNVTPHRGGTVMGRVTVPLAMSRKDTIHVNVDRIKPRNEPYYGHASVDSTGHYLISDLPPGTYKISAWRRDLEMKPDTIVINLDDTLVHDLKVKRDKSGKPAPVGCLQVNASLRSTAEIRFGLLDFHSRNRFGWIANEFTLGTEINFRFRDLILGPKINYTRTPGDLFFGIPYGASLIYYTDRSKGFLYLQPHAGVTLVAFIDVAIGYNIPLQNKTYFSERIPSLMLSVTIRYWDFDKFME